MLGVGQLGVVEEDARQAHLAPARRAQRLGDALADRRHAVGAVDGERHSAAGRRHSSRAAGRLLDHLHVDALFP